MGGDFVDSLTLTSTDGSEFFTLRPYCIGPRRQDLLDIGGPSIRCRVEVNIHRLVSQKQIAHGAPNEIEAFTGIPEKVADISQFGQYRSKSVGYHGGQTRRVSANCAGSS